MGRHCGSEEGETGETKPCSVAEDGIVKGRKGEGCEVMHVVQGNTERGCLGREKCEASEDWLGRGRWPAIADECMDHFGKVPPGGQEDADPLETAWLRGAQVEGAVQIPAHSSRKGT